MIKMNYPIKLYIFYTVASKYCDFILKKRTHYFSIIVFFFFPALSSDKRLAAAAAFLHAHMELNGSL